ncbi:alpha/beta hydrolase [Paenarthrobacter sp. NPDC057981]|uniref:alpha/beta hydrolase n=1 Tax=Paenarthrobacter sp. NPDC057981 TaxID=3346297 RepID=UPI0036D8685E
MTHPTPPSRRRKIRRRILAWTGGALGLILTIGIGGYLFQLGRNPATRTADGSYSHITTDTSFAHIAGLPAFSDYKSLMTPLADDWSGVVAGPLSMSRVLSYYGQTWEPQTIADGINFVVDEANQHEQLYFPLYKQEEIQADTSKRDAGMLFFPGDPGAPVAVVMPGGGWQTLAAVQEGFPHAQRLHDAGYNVFVLRYRVTPTPAKDDAEQAIRAQKAGLDVVRAMELIRDNETRWKVNLSNYSMWGSSAGGMLALQWASNLPVGAQPNGFPPPQATVLAYPATHTWPGVTAGSGPTFAITAADDPLIPVEHVDAVMDELRRAGVAVQYERVSTGGHGFGIGQGTPAAGWIDHAIRFWKQQAGTTPTAAP